MEKDVLEEIKNFADRAHGEQLRRYSGDRYIVHPERVMEMCREYTDDITILAAALLHDVLEDTDTTVEELAIFLLEVMDTSQVKKTVKLVEELTDVYVKKDFPRLNRDKRKDLEADRMGRISAEAQTIKYADIIDNTPDITQKDRGFARRYLKEVALLLDRMKKGNPDLRARALEVVEENQKIL